MGSPVTPPGGVDQILSGSGPIGSGRKPNRLRPAQQKDRPRQKPRPVQQVSEELSEDHAPDSQPTGSQGATSNLAVADRTANQQAIAS